jgi:hypothetical protein
MKILYDKKKAYIKAKSKLLPKKVSLSAACDKSLMTEASRIAEKTGRNPVDVYRELHPNTKIKVLTE